MLLLSGTSALAATDRDIESLRSEVQGMKSSYENRIRELEYKLSQMEDEKQAEQQGAIPSLTGNQISNSNNSFNPAIGVVLNGKYASFSENDGDIKGFATPEEGARGEEGMKLGESEIHLSANVDDKFHGSLTTSFVNEDGSDGLEIEEAFLQTLPGLGLPDGVSIKAGRAYWTLGYLNEQHSHADDFVDRPLPYRVFLNNSYNDDGVEFSYVLPTDFYSEIGGGLFRGDDYPFGSANGSDNGAWSAFARVGGDIAYNQTWRAGGYILSGQTTGRASNEDVVNFVGDTSLYVTDLRYTWAPKGNPNNEELMLQGEYFWRNEDGTYEDTDASTGAVNFDSHSSGWYAQGVYKFHPQWRVGYRYSQLQAPDVLSGLSGSILDSGGHDPDAHAVMVDWSNSEFSRLRLQYNYESPANGKDDNQVLLQYIMSIGAHPVHKY
jgi:hypothetical protein